MVVISLDASRVRGRSAIVAWFRIQRCSSLRDSGATEGLEVGEKDRSRSVAGGGGRSCVPHLVLTNEGGSH